MTEHQDTTPEVVYVEQNARGPQRGGWGAGYGIADPAPSGERGRSLWSSDGQAPATWTSAEAACENAAHCADLYPQRVQGITR